MTVLPPHIPLEIPPGGLSIGEVARATGVGIEALRYYEREGLMIDSTPRDGGGRRRFGARDIDWIAGLVMLRETGMPITSA